MKKRMKLTELLILLLCASTCLTSCLSDKNPVDGTDTSGSDTAGQKIEEQVPNGGDITETDDASTVPPPVIITPPANELDDIPVDNLDDPSSDIPAVEIEDEDPAADDPVVTESDTPAKEEGALVGLAGQRDSGRFVSEQSPNLILCIDWESVIGEDGVADVAVTVGISHYRFFSRAKSQMGAVQVDGNAILFDTPAIEYDENTKSYTFFGSYVFETDRSEMEVEASWQVLGIYGGVEIDTLMAGGTIVLGGES